MNTLQSLLIPNRELADSDEMFLRGSYQITSEGTIKIDEGQCVSTSTYFNSFSVEKWNKYTCLDELHLCGQITGMAEITISCQYYAGDILVEKNLDSKYINGLFDIDLSEHLNCKGVIHYTIRAVEKSIVSNIAYESSNDVKKIRIGLNICTFRRESYIYRLFDKYSDSSFKDNLHLFISDNASSLDKNRLSYENVHVVNNKNYGGASGFARGMYEIRRYNEQHGDEKIDYNIMMDDDILLDLRIFERLFSFLGLLKEEFEGYFLAGSMMSLDQPYWQYEQYASWRGDRFIQAHPNMDLRGCELIVYNEIESHLNRCSVGWWFCCVNTKMLTPNNYPFPCFFRGDDMEFAIRNDSKIITLNGICVWHEPFYKKYSIVNEDYYLLRNTLVINALYYPEVTYKRCKRFLIKKFMRSIFTYHYQASELIIRAIEDYMKGPSFFAETDAEQLNNELRKLNYKSDDVNEYLGEWSRFDLINEINSHRDKNKFHKCLRYLTLNGLLVPKCFYKAYSKSYVGFGNKYIDFYLRRNVINYDLFEDKAYKTHCSKKKAFIMLFKMKKTLRKLKRSYDVTRREYQLNFQTLQTESFWKEYLSLD